MQLRRRKLHHHRPLRTASGRLGLSAGFRQHGARRRCRERRHDRFAARDRYDSRPGFPGQREANQPPRLVFPRTRKNPNREIRSRIRLCRLRNTAQRPEKSIRRSNVRFRRQTPQRLPGAVAPSDPGRNECTLYPNRRRQPRQCFRSLGLQQLRIPEHQGQSRKSQSPAGAIHPRNTSASDVEKVAGCLPGHRTERCRPTLYRFFL